MKHYFNLQRRILDRKLEAFGITPMLAYVLAFIGFISLSMLLFYKTEYASWILLGAFFMICLPFSDQKRNEFLKLTYPHKSYYQLRLIENIIIAVPFIFILIYHQAYIFSIIILLCSIALSYYRNQFLTSITIPTPFSRLPYEFPSGFRKYILIFLLSFFLMFMAVSVGNFNLFAFSILLVIFTCISFYNSIEPAFYIRIYNKSSHAFLMQKLGHGLISLGITYTPILIIGLIYFPDNFSIAIIICVIGILYLITMILAKYSNYPKSNQFIDTIIISVSFIIVPFLFLLIPYYYKKSVKHLKIILT